MVGSISKYESNTSSLKLSERKREREKKEIRKEKKNLIRAINKVYILKR